MKKVVVLFMIIILGCLIYFNTKEYKNIKVLKKNLDAINVKLDDSNKEKKNYYEKENELNDLKDTNKDKISKLEEIETWNQEVTNYLD